MKNRGLTNTNTNKDTSQVHSPSTDKRTPKSVLNIVNEQHTKNTLQNEDSESSTYSSTSFISSSIVEMKQYSKSEQGIRSKFIEQKDSKETTWNQQVRSELKLKPVNKKFKPADESNEIEQNNDQSNSKSLNWFHSHYRTEQIGYPNNHLYKIETLKLNDDKTLPKRFIFDLVEVPKLTVKNKNESEETINNESFLPNSIQRKSEVFKTEKIDIYYFDHGNSGYYRTNDCISYDKKQQYLDKIEENITQFWNHCFSIVNIGSIFITTFIIQFFRLILYTMVRPLTIGFIQLSSDYFLKPLLAILFNGYIQPVLTLCLNITISFRDLCEPIAQSIGFFIREFSVIFKAIRFVDIRKNKNNYSSVK